MGENNLQDKPVPAPGTPPSANSSATQIAHSPKNQAPSASQAEQAVAGWVSKFRQELLIAGYSQKTISMYTRYAENLMVFVKKVPAEIKREDIVRFLAAMKERGASNATLGLVHASLRYFFKTWLKLNVLEDIKIPKKGKYLPVVLTKDEVRDLLKAAKHGRNRLLLQFIYSSGVRVSEAVNMKVEDINLKERMGKVRSGKGAKDRIIILSKNWCKLAKKYLNRKKIRSPYLFSKKNGKHITADTVQRIVRKAAKHAGITKEVTPHSLRHCFATHLLEAGENIRKIQELLGHANLNTTQIYTHVSTEQLKKVESPLDRL